MEILNLADHRNYLTNVIELIYSEWGTKGDSGNPNYWASWVSSSLSMTDIPQTYVAIEDNALIGTFSLWRCDLQSRQDLFPWFGGLYVIPSFRNKGVGKALQEYALTVLKDLGYKKVYLFAEFKNYYEKTGWVHIGTAPDEKDNIVNLYMHTI